jgi:antitoxin component of MazEF toxin-antitoxin module
MVIICSFAELTFKAKNNFDMEKHTSRQLKIYALHRSCDHREVPELRLSGVWVEQLGFKVGQTVNVIVRDRLLIIEPLEGEAKEEQEYKAALQEVKQTLKKLSK